MATVQPTPSRGDRDEADSAGEGPQLRKAGCKSVYLAENGKLVIQADLVDEATKANLLNLLAGEGAVEIDVDIVRAALARLM